MKRTTKILALLILGIALTSSSCSKDKEAASIKEQETIVQPQSPTIDNFPPVDKKIHRIPFVD